VLRSLLTGRVPARPGPRRARPRALPRAFAAATATVLAALVTGAPSAAAARAGADIREEQRWVFDALNVERAWRLGKGAGVTVALLDTRVRTSVKELKGKVTEGPDLSGFFYGDLRSPVGEHGTRMASLIAGSGKDGALSGVAPEARILSIPIAVELGETTMLPGGPADAEFARAVRYAVSHDAAVIVVPNGRYGAQRIAGEAVAYALARGVPVVASVGDDGASEPSKENGTSYWRFPAGYSGVIGVAAVDRDGRPAEFSSDNLSVLVAAPGVDVPVASSRGGRTTVSSTDAAAALVGGVVALIKARHPGLRPELVAQALTSSTRNRPEAGYDDRVGFGTVDAAAALERAAQLAGHRVSLPVDESLRFGGGTAAPEPEPPGPDPFRMWAYGLGVAFGLAAFAGGVLILVRRSERG